MAGDVAESDRQAADWTATGHRRDAIRNYHRILEAARDVLGESGAEASMEEIAARAGVGVGTVYRRFANKDALIDELLRLSMEDGLAAARQALDCPGGEGLEQLLRGLGVLFAEHARYAHLLLERSADSDEGREMRAAVATLTARAAGAGTLDPGVTAADIMTLIWAMRGVTQTVGEAAAGCLPRFLDIHLAGLRSPGPVSASPSLSPTQLAQIGLTPARAAVTARGGADGWQRRTSRWPDWPGAELAERKRQRGVTVSVVIPARNEERTVASVVEGIARLQADTSLVDELVVIDSDSTDRTATVAAAAGATVYHAREIAPELGRHAGKGEALWKSLLVTTGDLLVFVDADLTQWGVHFVTGLLGPLLADDGVLLVKGFYERLFAADDGSVTADGGRVTELVARPLLSLWWPELTGVVQPLAGEWAVRRDLLASLPIPVGYGIELAVLLDTARDHGLDAVAQVDLGRRGRKHQASHDLALMAAELMAVADRRRQPPVAGPGAEPVELHQFIRENGEMRRQARPVPVAERPPARSLDLAALTLPGPPRPARR